MLYSTEPVGVVAKECAGVAQLVELQFSKLNVASSSLVARSNYWESCSRPCGSVVEHSLGKGEVAGPIPAMGTMMVKVLLS
jgi:hypothetical protein